MPAVSVPAAAVPALPPFTAQSMGEGRAALSRSLRERLFAAGIRWPAWIDARPGRLLVLLGDCSAGPPLDQVPAYAARRFGALVLDGLAALGLVTGAPRLALGTHDPALRAELETLCEQKSVEVHATLAAYPHQPELDIPDAAGRVWSVPAETLLRVGAQVQGVTVPRLCTVAGAVRTPQVLELPSRPDAPLQTARQLAERCGGAEPAAWVALTGGALGGTLWLADDPLPPQTTFVLVLPVDHPLVRRYRETDLSRAVTACLGCRICTEYCPEAQRGLALAPHETMRARGSGPVAAQLVSAALACTGCGVCSALCPAELLPDRLLAELRDPAARPALATDEPIPPADPNRRIPLGLVLTRLGLDRFRPVAT